MCLIAPQQNHTDSPLCYTGGSPSGVTAFGSLRFASLRHPRGSSFNGVALFQFTETFLHSRKKIPISDIFHQSTKHLHSNLFRLRALQVLQVKGFQLFWGMRRLCEKSRLKWSYSKVNSLGIYLWDYRTDPTMAFPSQLLFRHTASLL